MRFTMPTELLTLDVFMRQFLEAVFPDLEPPQEDGQKISGSKYVDACNEAAIQRGILSYGGDGMDVRKTSNLYYLMLEFANQCNTLLENSTPYDVYIRSTKPSLFTKSLDACCNKENRGLDKWLREITNSLNNYFEVSLFFTYLLLSRDDCKETRLPFLIWSLQQLGVSEFEYAYAKDLAAPFSDKKKVGGVPKLQNRATILMGATFLMLCKLIGRPFNEKAEEQIAGFHNMMRELFAEEEKAKARFDVAEQILLDCNEKFVPRSIATAGPVSLQEVFVMPNFSMEEGTPFSQLNDEECSKKCLLEAKTGLGKSSFLQMATLCMLKQVYRPEQVAQDKVFKSLRDQLKVPSDMYIISVPARMFSYCYSFCSDIEGEAYKPWTQDFVELFFNCMWQKKDNFFSHPDALIESDYQTDATKAYMVTDALRAYVTELARAGKLLLILDSFDEIPSGDMRKDYLTALGKFRDNYCFSTQGVVGAHIMASSRKMSSTTMTDLTQAMGAGDGNVIRINALGEVQQEALVRNWRRRIKKDEDDSEQILEELKQNHYCREYAENPYMLSVICSLSGQGLNEISTKLVKTLADKMRENNERYDTEIQDVLHNLETYLQRVAWGTVKKGKPHFSSKILNKMFEDIPSLKELSEKERKDAKEVLHEIFVTKVGLIVPADGNDSAYQFINDQIRLWLAAKYIENGNINETALFKIKNFEQYVGVFVPLFCMDKENNGLLEKMIYDLVMRDLHDEKAQQLLIRAILDLLLNRYDTNALSSVNVQGTTQNQNDRAQRLALLRLFTMPELDLTEEEKQMILGSNAYKNHKSWLSSDIEKFLATPENP